jgi:N-acetylmuramoyl-L-alanine amidase
VEVGFLSNEQEAANLARADYQRQLATAIYRGVMRYLSNEKFPSSAEDSSASL